MFTLAPESPNSVSRVSSDYGAAQPKDAIRARPTDINHFIESCFTNADGTPIVQAEIHRELQAFLGRNSRAIVELPRDHGKSFQLCCRLLWELAENPGLRIKIVCATDTVAAQRSRFIRDAVTANARVQRSFPQLKRGQPWSANAFTIARSADSIGPSIAAFGVGAGSTGTRADLLVCDDIVDVRAIHSRADRDRVADYFTNNLMNLLEPHGRFWGLCTPWHMDDLNARLKKNSAYAVFRRAVGIDCEPVWPEKWPREKLLARKAEIGSASFARGYRLVPVATEETPIRAEWIRYWDEPAEYDTVLLSVDPAVSVSAKADRSAIVVLGRCKHTPAIHVLAVSAKRVKAPELVTLIDEYDRFWNPAVILFESNAAFLGIKDILTRHARFGPRLKSITQTADKGSRVAAFSVGVENGAFRLRGNAGVVDTTQRELFDEMTTFPFAEHDDLLDAVATGCAYLLDRREPRVW
jgi:phage terminase large subunit-like protein